LSIVQGAALASAYPIIAIDRFDNRLELARQLGATHVLNANESDLEQRIRDIVGEPGLDVAVDNTGNVQVIEMAYRLTGPRGRTVLVGVPPKGSTAAIHTLPLHFEKTLVGSHGGECNPSVDIPNYVRLHQAGRLDFKSCIGQRYSLAEINQAIDDMVSGRFAGRPIIEFPDD
jgi:S-(hydroxymethyl)glutathione dehydrogenase/alcohol dehydrogenase